MPWFESYSGSLRRRAQKQLRPTAVATLVEAVRAHDPARDGPITVRASGHSFHHQALGGGTMLVLDRLPHQIRVTLDDTIALASSGAPLRWHTVEVTGWTPWDAIVRAGLRLRAPDGWHVHGRRDVWLAEPHATFSSPAHNDCRFDASAAASSIPRLIPYCFVSSGRITAAGSLSGDGVWRMSSVLGRESDSVVWLDLLRSDGASVRLFNSRWGLWDQRQRHGAAPWTPTRAQNDAWFDVVVGGFGLAGVVLRAKYLLLTLDDDLDWRAFGVQSHAQRSRAQSEDPAEDMDVHEASRQHERLAAALDALGGVPAQWVAAHWAACGQHARAHELFLAAGRDAMAKLAFDEAAQCYREALSGAEALSTATSVRRALAQALAFAGRAEQAAQSYERCALSSSGQARDDDLAQAALCFILAGAIDRGLTLLGRVLHPFGLRLPPRRSALLFWLLTHRFRTRATRRRGRPGDAARWEKAADLTHAAATRLSSVDVILAAYVQGMHQVCAHNSRDPVRVARAMAVEAGLRATRGAGEAEICARLAELQGTLGTRDEPRTRALMSLVRASAAWSAGRWRTCVDAASEAERVAAAHCSDAWWEIGHARAVLQDALRWSGRYHELARTYARYLRDAEARGDRFALVTFRVRFGSTLELVRDAPEAARPAFEAASSWTRSGVHLQHLAAFHARIEHLLYVGQPERALAYALDRFRTLRRSALLTAGPPRAKVYHQLAVCRLACAAREAGAARRALIRRARRDATKVRRSGWAYTWFLADVVQRTAQVLEGAGPGSHAELRRRAEALEMPQFAAALASADAQPEVRREGRAQLCALGVASPTRFGRVLLPGLLRNHCHED